MGALPQIQPLRSEPEDSRESGSRDPASREAQSMETLGRMVGGVAHDFNNLLTGIVLCCDLMLAKMERTSPLRRYAEEIRCAGTQGASLIQQLLTVTRQRAVEPRVLNLNQVLDGLRNLMVRLIGEDIELRLELAGDLRAVKVDPAQMQQIVLNLVLNARDAMPDGGRIWVHTRNVSEREAWVELAVGDTGCGMTRETVSHIFEPFFTTKKAGQGNGLGLATVRAIVKQYGGSIRVESEPGKGTRFLIRLPQCERAETPELIRGISV
jgi:signal transduction histidine kinase